jgi:hypothetical protein
VAKSIAPWLQQVAWRTASRLRGKAARRRFHERRAAEGVLSAVSDDGYDDLGAVVQEELGRLAARFRVPLVLCYLEGMTAEQAARQLGWPSGTVRSRLARGRERLRARLIRRGVAPSAAGLAAALTSGDAWAALPPKLSGVTAQWAVQLAEGRLVAGPIPASILTLTEGVLKAMAITKFKMAATVLAVGLATTALALGQAQPSGGGPAPASEITSTGRPGPSANSESARLQQVELKLDRVLEALGASAPAEKPRFRRRLAKIAADPTAAEELPKEDLLPGLPRARTAEEQPRVASSSAKVSDPFAAENSPLRARSSQFVGVMSDNISVVSRLERVEQNLAELVERVNQLERFVHKATRGEGGVSRPREEQRK